MGTCSMHHVASVSRHKLAWHRDKSSLGVTSTLALKDNHPPGAQLSVTCHQVAPSHFFALYAELEACVAASDRTGHHQALNTKQSCHLEGAVCYRSSNQPLPALAQSQVAEVTPVLGTFPSLTNILRPTPDSSQFCTAHLCTRVSILARTKCTVHLASIILAWPGLS